MRCRVLVGGSLMLVAAGVRFPGGEIRARFSQAPVTASLDAALAGGEPVRVLVGMAGAGSGEARVARIRDHLPANSFQPLLSYRSFPMLCALTTPEAVRTLALLPEVAWIALDETRWPLSNDPQPQPAQWLVRSPQANDAGFGGAGETIAIIDTGVDYKIADFGGGEFPNAKVVGGYDTADEDPDPLDCDGHGTQVAGVAAGPSGVAPDARVVAVKVFSSRDPASDVCERRTTDSEILQGIDWVASNAAQFSIGVVNISLGIPFDDGAEHGFCDTEQPAYAMAVARLTAAGAAVFAAAGNDASPRFVSAPGCVTSANAVGAVYSEPRTRAAWGDDSGGTLCVDEPALVDQVGCFSNSTRGVALLAPGAFWLVPTKDGLASAFAATSAATPAAAGAALLARQALPGLSPSAVAGILRLTGKPVADARNGLCFPRIDVLDAVHFARSRFFESLESPAPIPDGAGEARLRIAIPQDAIPISRLSVGVRADHPAPDQLRISLVDPVGRTIVLRNRNGTAARPVLDLYGELDAPAEPLDSLVGTPPGGTWTLVVRDLVPGQTGRVLGFFLFLDATGRLAVDPPDRPRPAPRSVPPRPHVAPPAPRDLRRKARSRSGASLPRRAPPPHWETSRAASYCVIPVLRVAVVALVPGEGVRALS